MGVSTDGILVYGIDLEEEFPLAWGEYDPDDDDYEFDIDEFIDERTGEVPAVEVVWHCSYHYPMYILAIPGTRIRALRGYPESIDSSSLEIDPQKIQAFNAWIEKYIPEDQRPDAAPSWLLCSMWG